MGKKVSLNRDRRHLFAFVVLVDKGEKENLEKKKKKGGKEEGM